jgi:hypothetical protein
VTSAYSAISVANPEYRFGSRLRRRSVNGLALQASTAVTALLRCCPGCLGRGQPRRRGRHQQPPFTPTSPSRLLNLSLSPPPVPNLAAVEELVVDVLAAGLAYLLELLVVGLIRQILAAQ